MGECDLNQIAQITVERHFPAGEVIIEENTPADRFYLISQGKVRITKRFEDGEEVELGLQSGGDFFGEIAILDAGPRSATVRALEPTTVLEISRQDFQVLLIQAPELAYAIMKELSARLRETGALLVSYLRQRNRDLTQALLGIARVVDSLDAGLLARFRRIAGIAEAVGRQVGGSEEELLLLKAACLFYMERGDAAGAREGDVPREPGRAGAAGARGERWLEWARALRSALILRRPEHAAEAREGRRVDASHGGLSPAGAKSPSEARGRSGVGAEARDGRAAAGHSARAAAPRPFPLEQIILAAVSLAPVLDNGPAAAPPEEAALRELLQSGAADPIDSRVWKAVLAGWRSGALSAVPMGEG
jgi:CRP-like cAMP-binding protein